MVAKTPKKVVGAPEQVKCMMKTIDVEVPARR